MFVFFGWRIIFNFQVRCIRSLLSNAFLSQNQRAFLGGANPFLEQILIEKTNLKSVITMPSTPLGRYMYSNLHSFVLPHRSYSFRFVLLLFFRCKRGVGSSQVSHTSCVSTSNSIIFLSPHPNPDFDTFIKFPCAMKIRRTPHTYTLKSHSIIHNVHNTIFNYIQYGACAFFFFCLRMTPPPDFGVCLVVVEATLVSCPILSLLLLTTHSHNLESSPAVIKHSLLP